MISVDSPEATRKVREYYDRSHKWYKAFYIEPESLGIHYGFWSGASSKAEALINQYKEILEILKPQPGEHILDAGCGVGGLRYGLQEIPRPDIRG